MIKSSTRTGKISAISCAVCLALILCFLMPVPADSRPNKGEKDAKENTGPAALIDKSWEAFKAVIESGSSLDEAEGRFKELMEARLSSDTMNLFDHSTALLSMAQVKLKNGQPEDAHKLIEWAIELSPTFPSPRFAMARQKLLNGELGPAIDFTRDGISALTSSFRASFPIKIKAIYALFGAIMLVPLIYAITLIIRKSKLLANDLEEIWVSGPTGVSFPLVMALLLLPLIIIGNLTYYSLLLAVVLWPYLAKWERFTAVCLTITIMASPFLITLVGKGIVISNDPTINAAVNLREGVWSMEDLEILENRLTSMKKSDRGYSEMSFLVATALKRSGEMDPAENIYLKLAKGSDYEGKAKNNLGIIYLAKEDFGQATNNLREASRLLPDSLEPLFNLSMTYYNSGDTEKGDEVIAEARNKFTNSFEVLEAKLGYEPGITKGIRTADLTLNVREFSKLAYAICPDPGDISDDLWSMWASKRFGLSSVFPLLGLAVLIAFVMEALRPKFIFSVSCVSCGDIFREDEETHHSGKSHDMCPRCSAAILAKGGGIDPRSKLKALAEARNYQSRSANISMLASIFFPGLGEFIRGKPVRGTIFASIVIFFAMMIFGFKPNSMVTLEGISFASNVNLIFLAIFYIIIVVISAWDARSRR